MSVNVLGCLAIGFFSTRFEALAIPGEVRMAVLVGLLGGFTTFSSFSLETLQMMENHQMPRAMVNVVLSVLLCLLSCWSGQRLACLLTVS